jgi:hypothetical protein
METSFFLLNAAFQGAILGPKKEVSWMVKKTVSEFSPFLHAVVGLFPSRYL